MMSTLRRLLSRKMTLAAMLEVGLWLAIPYVMVGVIWSYLNPTAIERRQVDMLVYMPVAADLLAFGESTVLWPVLMIAPGICTN